MSWPLVSKGKPETLLLIVASVVDDLPDHRLRITEGADMDFTIQYFGIRDHLHYEERVDVGEMVEALDHARDMLKAHQPASGTLSGAEQLVGYVILDQRGRQVARGYIGRPLP
jgi:hypothetical protein